MKTERSIIKPKRIEKGSCVRLIAPAGFLSREQLDYTVSTLKTFGLEAIFTETVLKKEGFLAGTDQERLDDLHAAFLCKKSDSILCIRGGYGTMRLLQDIDYDLIRLNPKPLIGYSDITALLQAIYKFSGVVGFHGVVGISDFDEYTQNCFRQIFIENNWEQPVISNKVIDNKELAPKATVSGKARGVLVGGNLSLLVSLLGTPYDIDWAGKLVFIEDVNEPPYIIDKYLTQLLLSKKMQSASGIILGTFAKCDIDGIDVTKTNSFSLLEVIKERLGNLNIPIIYGFSFGHIEQQAIFPVGLSAEMDTDSFSVNLLESPFYE